MSTVEVTKDLRTILNIAKSVNQNLRICANDAELRIKDEGTSIVLFADLGVELPQDLYLYDVSEFLSVCSLSEKPVIEFFEGENYLEISDSENPALKIVFVTSDENLINSYVEDDKIEILDEATEEIAVDVTVSSDVITKVINASKTLKTDYIGFVGDGERVLFSAFCKTEGSGVTTNSFSIDVGETDAEFEMFYQRDTFNTIPVFDQKDVRFQLCPTKVSIVDSNGFKLYMVLSDESKFEG